MFRPWKFILFFVLCLLVALLLNLPVQQVLARAKLPASVQLGGVDGSLLQGRAETVTVNQFALHGVRYRFKPACLPLLKVCYLIDYDQGQLQVGYDLLNGDTELDRSHVEYPVAELLKRFPASLPVKPSGSLQLEIDELSLQQDVLAAVSGRLVWRNLGVRQDDVQIDIGDYQVDFSGNPGQYDFTFSDLDAALDVSGDGRISADGQYTVDVRVAAESAVDPKVRTLLELIGKRSGVNKYRIEQQGRLPPKITRQLFP